MKMTEVGLEEVGRCSHRKDWSNREHMRIPYREEHAKTGSY